MQSLIARSILVSSFTLLLATACGSSAATQSGDENPSAAGASAASTGSIDADAGAGGANDAVVATAGTSNGGQAPDLNEGEYSLSAFAAAAAQVTTFNPLGRDRFNLIRLEETAVIAPKAMNAGWTLDDARHGFSKSNLLGALVPAGATPVWAGSGNLDDDGNAELVVVSHDAKNLTIAIGDNTGATPLAQVRSFTVPHGGALVGAVKVTLGDFDGDGHDEICLGISGPGGSGWVRVYDDASSHFTLLKEVVQKASGQADLDLVAGNFDDDAAIELGFLRLGKATDDLDLTVFDDAGHGFGTLKTWQASELLPDAGMGDDKTVWESSGFLRAGNIDHDAQEELYLMLTHRDVGSSGSGGTRVMGRMIDDVSKSAKIIATPSVGSRAMPRADLSRLYEASFADLDGDGMDELYFLHLQETDQDNAWMLTQWNPTTGDYAWSKAANYTVVDPGYQPGAFGRMAVVDGDGISGEGLVIALQDRGGDFPIKTVRVSAHATVQANDVKQSYALDIGKPEATQAAYPSSLAPLVAGGDYDNDSLQVRYTGDHWQTLSDPRPLVVMAAPPMQNGISAAYASSATAFGETASHSTANSNEVGTSYSTTLSFESSTITGLFGAFGGIAGGNVSKTLERAFSDTNTVSELVSTGVTFSGAYPDDCVVFQGVLYTSYSYEIISASDAAAIGKHITVDVPAAIKTYKWTLGFYNQKLPASGIAIGKETLMHTVGDPASYMTPAQRDAIIQKNGGFITKQVTVGQGNGSNTVTVDLEHETTTATTNTITNDSSWGIAIAGAGYESSEAVSSSGTYQVTVGTSTIYQGSVGDILRNDDYLNYSYDFGMAVYNFTHPQGPKFQVINYWTANLGPAFK